ncbi:MAG: chorismate mutase [Actinomycetota bacterium]|jgi:chorismate mutase|nr:chorismate mutase [Actinomycetota bacterium]MEA2844687.1 chorismate mutase [Actinomycetota bacterium]
MPSAVRALRGATTVDADTEEDITKAVQTLIGEMLSRNDVEKDDLISIVFTATEDLTATFPATPARLMGLGDVPLLSARELSVPRGSPRCIRVLMHLATERSRSELRHVYLEGAVGLNDDLPV